ncbi:MAG: 16S rRNA (adenine(1518)-N(6)/adenine(1519)-N(6))-dimethyltransferase RsmA [Candidatus Pacebacteria bacterium]|nr:16S rRNA (adenine(1518)-N(6)/adenine(1519)-N(6))-dimethyltransferase RsmA [Candidatus Paceibacterota bacterium]
MKPQKKLGQNFLINKSAIKKIVDALEISDSDIIIEIGAGTGNLTQEILKRSKKVIAIEKDKSLIPLLRLKFQKNSHSLQIIEGDVREILPTLASKLKKFKVVGNIPYYLTGRLLRIFQELTNAPQLIVLTLQKEVTERLVAQPPQMNQLAVIVQLWAKPKIILQLKPKDFFPPPKVRSTVVQLKVKSSAERYNKEKELIPFIVCGFQQPRKTLLNNLSREYSKEKIKQVFEQLNLTEKTRPAEISVEMWITLFEYLNS